ncbi:hypothetical protein HANVADRAFT_23830 [Hanseniaspora valbyensis NRRL Y-1626]|uniref:Proteasome maturation factor UMP1 n=1 Tax=Hanseniaspora valbyensis NRRL Y-1626 TaxID=766949 RepID=A0A1B7TEP0_9ASCO|nr:hypothetical protein HANVADRAFT_23830 [Hanseniaspora valbyensis NRRL Y-1626]
MDFIPSANYQSQVSTTKNSEFVNNAIPSLPDKLKQQSTVPIAMKIKGKHPLQERLQQWEQKQFQLKLEQEKKVFGLHLPMKIMMEKEIIDSVDNFSIVNELRKESQLHPATSIHQDIINNKEYDIDYEDIYYTSNIISNNSDKNTDVHTAIEKQLKL